MIRRAATLATLAALCFLRNVDCEAGAAIPDDERLAELVATTAFESIQRSAEGTVVARFEDLEKREPVRIWVWVKGTLRDGSKKEFKQAVGNDRKKWPPYTLLYTVSPGAAGKYELEINIYYDMGLFPESRGGYAERWTVAYENGRWEVLDQETTLHWD